MAKTIQSLKKRAIQYTAFACALVSGAVGSFFTPAAARTLPIAYQAIRQSSQIALSDGQSGFDTGRKDGWGGLVQESSDTVRYTLPQASDFANESETAQDNIQSRRIDLDPGLPESEMQLESSPAILEPSMTAVSDPGSWPYGAIVQLELEFAGQPGQKQGITGEASGVVIGPNTILTCAHCVYERDSGLQWARSIEIHTARGKTYSSRSETMQASVYKTWIQDGNSSRDIAILALESPIGNQTGMLKPSSQAAPGSPIKMAGYTRSTMAESLQSRPLMESQGTVRSLAGSSMTFDLYGQKGQSGAPVFNASNELIGLFGFGQMILGQGLLYTGGVAFDPARLEWTARNSDLESPIYRLYNPNSSEHFYTASFEENSFLEKAGWKTEGLAWYGAGKEESAGLPVYRLYNPNAGDHHYTTDENEYAILAGKGWRQEGIAWHTLNPASDAESGLEGAASGIIYRLYNPNAQSGAHHFTASQSEREYLIHLGWKDEGQAFSRS